METMRWNATKPQGIAGVGSRPWVSMQTQMPTLHAAAFTVKAAAGSAAVYGTGVSVNLDERPEGPRGRAG